MKDFYTIDNITKRSQKALEAISNQPNSQMKLAGLEFGRPKPVTIPKNLNSSNINNFKDSDVFRIIEKSYEDEVVHDESDKQSIS